MRDYRVPPAGLVALLQSAEDVTLTSSVVRSVGLCFSSLSPSDEPLPRGLSLWVVGPDAGAF